MADITTLGISINLEQVKRAISSLETLAKAANTAEKQVQEIGEAAKDSGKAVVAANDKAVASFAKAARAMKQLEDAQLSSAKTEVERAKSSRIAQQQLDASLAAKIQRENAYAAAIDRSARLAQESSSRQAATSAREAANLALKQKYLDQGNAALSKTAAFAANQQSLIENRTLTTQARIEQGAQRLALQQEKFEYQKQRAAERAAKGTGDSWKGVLATLRDLTVVGVGAGGVVGFATSTIKTADNLTLLDSRLKLATKSQEEFKNVQESLYASSIKNGFNIESQVNSYTQLQRSTKAMGLTTEQLTFLTDSFAKAAVVSGASTESYKSALTQLNQGMASGVLRGQEFNSVAEQAPAILEALANGMRGSNKEFDNLEKKGYLGVAALRKMANEGKLVNSTTMPALIEGLKETNKQFDQMPPTVGRAVESLSSSFKKWLNDQNTASGATQTLANGLIGLSKNFDDVVKVATTAGTFLAALYGAKLTASFVSFTKEQVAATIATVNQERALIAQATAARAGAVATEQATLAQRAFTTASNAAALSASLLGKAFNFIGGWPMLVAAGVTLVVAYWDDLRIAMGNTRVEAEKTGNAVVEAIEKGNRAAANALIQEKKIKAQEAQQQLDLAQKRVSIVEQRLNLPTVSAQTYSPYNPEFAQQQQQEKARSAAIKGLAGRSKDEWMLAQRDLQNAKQTVFEANAVVNAAEAAKTRASAAEVDKLVGNNNVPSTIAGKSPVAEPPKPKGMRSGLTGEQSALESLKAQIDYLNQQKKDLQDINNLKSDSNEWDKKADEYSRKADAVLNDKKIKNKEVLYEQYSQLALHADIAAGVQREIDKLKERNKLIAASKQDLIDFNEKFNRAALSGGNREGRSDQDTADILNRKLSDITAARSDVLAKMNEGANGDVISQMISDANAKIATIGLSAMDAVNSAEQMQIAQLEKLRETYQQRIDVVKFAEDEITRVKDEAAKARIAIENDETAKALDSKKTMVMEYSHYTDQLMSVIQAAGAEQTALGKVVWATQKALAIASTIINTEAAATAVLAPPPIGLGPVAGLTMAGTIRSMGYASVAAMGAVAGIEASQKFAKGGVFDGAVGSGGTVVNTPTNFQMGNGQSAQMGERGSEAIMPLRRDAKGRLGVSMVGGNGGNQSVQTNHIQINVQAGENANDTANAVNDAVLKAMKSVARQEIVEAKRQRVIS